MATANYLEVAAISMALHDYMENNCHDVESYTLTIKRRPARIITERQTCPQRIYPGRKIK